MTSDYEAAVEVEAYPPAPPPAPAAEPDRLLPLDQFILLNAKRCAYESMFAWRHFETLAGNLADTGTNYLARLETFLRS